MISQKLVKSFDYEIYQYGLTQLMTYIFFVIALLIICSFIGSFLEFFYLFFLFVSTRSLLGGIHLKNKYLCFVVSCVFLVGVLFMFKLLCNSVPFQSKGNMLLSIALFQLIITIYQPIVDHPNKRISEREKLRFKKFSIKLLMFQMGVLIVLNFCGFRTIIDLSVAYYLLFHISRLVKIKEVR